MSIRRARRGVTLIELLITVSILAILAALILGATPSATEAARRAKTRTIISKIHALVMERYNSYKTRRVDVSPNLVNWVNLNYRRNPQTRGRMMADLRLLALRELMKYEMPDRWSDITGVNVNEPPMPPIFLSAPPSLAQNYLRRYQALDPSGSIAENQGAECLYMVVMLATGNGEARTHFGEQDIGDTDNDGAPEFLDGWGNPIHWLRWPAGFAVESTLITGFDPSGNIELGYTPEQHHDPFDPFRRDQPDSLPGVQEYQGIPVNLGFIVKLREAPSAFRLVPLIYSAGPDGISDIVTAREDVVTGRRIFLDPYYVDPDERIIVAGRPIDANNDGNNWVDNIHNHQTDNQ